MGWAVWGGGQAVRCGATVILLLLPHSPRFRSGLCWLNSAFLAGAEHTGVTATFWESQVPRGPEPLHQPGVPCWERSPRAWSLRVTLGPQCSIGSNGTWLSGGQEGGHGSRAASPGPTLQPGPLPTVFCCFTTAGAACSPSPLAADLQLCQSCCIRFRAQTPPPPASPDTPHNKNGAEAGGSGQCRVPQP